ncbi:MAG TPA: hypothetical protein VJN88_00950 [Ktedonobacterales bacterium]|nr:hypothetical protein [Ktedonobacterales bacterium]
MKIIVMPKPRAGVPIETVQRHAAEEIQALLELYAQGVCREFYSRANEPGRVVFVIESANEESARDTLATLPFVRLGLIDLDVIPLAPFAGIGRLIETTH